LLLKLGIKDDVDQIGQKDKNRKLVLEEALADYELRMCFFVQEGEGGGGFTGRVIFSLWTPDV
jgi:hypothetical protein